MASSAREEWSRQLQQARGVQPPLPREEAGEEGEDEQTEVAGVEQLRCRRPVQPHPEQLGYLDRERRGHRQAEGHDGLPLPICPLFLSFRYHQALPQPLRVLPGELPGQRVEFAEALHPDQEGLLLVEPRLPEVSHLAPEVVLELIHVRSVDRLSSAHVGPPLMNPFFEHRHASFLCHQIPCGASWNDMNGVERSVSLTTCHCRCWFASSSEPWSVIR